VVVLNNGLGEVVGLLALGLLVPEQGVHEVIDLVGVGFLDEGPSLLALDALVWGQALPGASRDVLTDTAVTASPASWLHASRW
jgi:hypothetical protein